MVNIDDIFKFPNIENALYIKCQIINRYKKVYNIPNLKGINIFEIKKWAEQQFKEIKENYFYFIMEEDSCPICGDYLSDGNGNIIDCKCGAVYDFDRMYYLIGSSNKESKEILSELLKQEE